MYDKRSSTLPKNGQRLSDLVDMSARELVALAQSGDLEAFDPLYRRYAPEVLRYAVRKADGNRDLGEDLAAQAWATAMATIGNFHDDGDEHGFVRRLYGIVKQSHAWRFARLRGEVTTDEIDLVSDYRQAATAMQSADGGTDWQRLRGLLAPVLGTLPQQAQQVARLRLDGLDNDEIAERAGLSVEQVRELWAQAFDLLRQAVSPRAGATQVTGRPRLKPRKASGRLTLPANFDQGAFLKAAMSLPAAARRVALLKLENLPNAEIAQALGCAVGTVGSHWRRACLAFAKVGLIQTTDRAFIPAGAMAMAADVTPQELRAAVATLSPAMARITGLSLDGLSQKQIAEELGCSTGTVGTTLFNARRLLAGRGIKLPAGRPGPRRQS
ncbi:sigma-70 family RNA polymerase sigma factor [Catellatospora sp. NPDC049609]|uniref:sigma-70 family RNA polymerase sigma factor n=1 Tax=Catellatospora sp. NPDC049609 TaxID=3155505 RepID=UPI003416094F